MNYQDIKQIDGYPAVYDPSSRNPHTFKTYYLPPPDAYVYYKVLLTNHHDWLTDPNNVIICDVNDKLHLLPSAIYNRILYINDSIGEIPTVESYIPGHCWIVNKNVVPQWIAMHKLIKLTWEGFDLQTIDMNDDCYGYIRVEDGDVILRDENDELWLLNLDQYQSLLDEYEVQTTPEESPLAGIDKVPIYIPDRYYGYDCDHLDYYFSLEYVQLDENNLPVAARVRDVWDKVVTCDFVKYASLSALKYDINANKFKCDGIYATGCVVDMITPEFSTSNYAIIDEDLMGRPLRFNDYLVKFKDDTVHRISEKVYNLLIAAITTYPEEIPTPYEECDEYIEDGSSWPNLWANYKDFITADGDFIDPELPLHTKSPFKGLEHAWDDYGVGVEQSDTPKYTPKHRDAYGWQLTPENRNADVYPYWISDAFNKDVGEVGRLFAPGYVNISGTLVLTTTHGDHSVEWCDWIIKGDDGELAVCSPHFFETILK